MGGIPNRTRPVRPVTIGDVALAAGVSKATVSRVMNGLSTVNAEIADKVRKTMLELGYSPSGTARSLSLGLNKTVGVLVPDLANPMFQQFLHGVHHAAAADGYRVLVTDSQEVVDDEVPLLLDARDRTDAVVLCAPRMSEEALVGLLPRVKPAVVINREAHSHAGAAVGVDYAAGIRLLAEHLVELGHTRMAYLEGPPMSRSQAEREVGLRQFERAHPEVWIKRLPCGSSLEDGYRAWDDLKDSDATAVLAFNDLVALGLLHRLNQDGVAVPDRISITGMDDIPFARFSAPPLTTIQVPMFMVGEAAWKALRAELTGESDIAPVTFLPELLIRESTGPRP